MEEGVNDGKERVSLQDGPSGGGWKKCQSKGGGLKPRWDRDGKLLFIPIPPRQPRSPPITPSSPTTTRLPCSSLHHTGMGRFSSARSSPGIQASNPCARPAVVRSAALAAIRISTANMSGLVCHASSSGVGWCGGGGRRWRGALTSTPSAAVMQLTSHASPVWMAYKRRDRVTAMRLA